MEMSKRKKALPKFKILLWIQELFYIAYIEDLGIWMILFYRISNNIEIYKWRLARFKDKSNETPKRIVYGFPQGHHIHHIIGYDSVGTRRVILLVLSFDMKHYLEGLFVSISDWDDILSEVSF